VEDLLAYEVEGSSSGDGDAAGRRSRATCQLRRKQVDRETGEKEKERFAARLGSDRFGPVALSIYLIIKDVRVPWFGFFQHFLGPICPSTKLHITHQCHHCVKLTSYRFIILYQFCSYVVRFPITKPI
jgi:hypothetical protein